ncbi:MAG TPA: proline--tRNA ligase, partial [Bacteroidetes bacterium]|nr:proline--tRNA ligase [Bacteroidota bacterium]
LEIATSDLTELVDEPTRLEEVSTPNVRTIEEVSEFLNVPASRFIKSLVYIVDDEPILILIRGDHELNESKMQVRFGAKFRPAAEDEIEKIMDGTHTGFIGPVGLKGMAIYVDKTVVNQKGFISGANKDHFHLKGIDLKRDISIREIIDVSTVKAGEKCPECGYPLRIVNAIEIGHIFKLGTKYSEAMNATVLNPGGEKVPIIMGSYGIGVERILATHIEQNSDDKGIVWSKALAPYFVHIIPINVKNESVLEQAEAVYDYCNQEKISALIDDRNVGPGFKLKDADLLGMPLQIIVGEKNLKNNRLEFKIRRLQKSFLVDVNHYKEELKGTLQKIE